MSVTPQKLKSEVVKCLAKDGGTLVFLDVPMGTEFGIDMNVFRVGEKFKGVKMIPPGLHFVFYSAVNKEECAAPRTSFFHFFKSGELVVKKWDKLAEDISDTPSDADEIERLRSNISSNLDRYLAAYPYDSWKKWISLTNHITESVMEKLQPENKKISSVTPLIPLSYPLPEIMDTDQPVKRHRNMEDNLLPHMKPVPGTEIRFSNIPNNNYPDGATPSQITHFCMDATYSLERIFTTYSQPSDILGELQLAFVCFILGQVYDAFEQWKHMVNLFTSCDEALVKYSQFYSDLITVMHFQLKEVPSDFFVDIVSSNNFLTVSLQRFFQNLKESNASVTLKDKGLRFKDNLTKSFKWDFDYEPPDEAPVVVELPQNQVATVIEVEP